MEIRNPRSAIRSEFGAYELLEEVGRGGMGVVYKARQKSLERIVALKLLLFGPQAPPESVKRFRAEAAATAALQHPNIVAIHEVGVTQGQHYLAMDYVEGRSLAQVISDFGSGFSDWRRAVGYVKTIAEAVHYAHERGILHRDLKPANILIDANDQPRITDFGLAKRLPHSSLSSLHSALTVSGQVLGSPNYMPPEQAAGRRGKASRRSDVYALGAILFHALTGRPPFVGEGLADTVQQVLNTEPVSPRAVNPRLPADLETVCLKCLEKEPDRRYPTAQALAEDLGRWLDRKPILARPLGPAGKAWRWGRRNPRLALTTIAALLSLTLGLAGVTWQWRVAKAQQTRAEAEALLARRHAYAADMKAVQRALAEGDLGRAREVLDRHRPPANDVWRVTSDEPGTPGVGYLRAASSLATPQSSLSTDLRGWEWRYLWARCQSHERFTLCALSNSISALALSPDGKWLALRLGDERLVLWDTVARRQVSEWAGGGTSKALAFSPPGNLLAWGTTGTGGPPAVILYDLSMRMEIDRLEHSHRVLSIAFSPDARQVAVLAFDGMVRLWNLETKQIIADFPTPRDNGSRGRYSVLTHATKHEPLWSNASDDYGRVLFSPDGRWLVIGEAKPRLRLVDRATHQESMIPLPPSGDGITALAISEDSQRLAAGCGYQDRRVHVWDRAAGTNGTLPGHNGYIKGLAFSPDGQWLASVSTDQSLRLWDLARGDGHRLQGHVDEVCGVAWSRDGQAFVTGARDGSVRYWDPAVRPRPSYLVLPPICYVGPSFLPDSKTFLAARKDGSVVRLRARWDGFAVAEVEKLSFLGTNHSSLALSRDGRWLALGDWAGNIRVWDFLARRQTTNLLIPDSRVAGLIFSPRGHWLNCGALLPDGRITSKFWDTATWRERRVQDLGEMEVVGFSFSPDDRIAACGFTDGTAAWYDLKTGKQQQLFDLHADTRVGVQFSPDGRLFATRGLHGQMAMWDVATLRSRPIPRSHRSRLYGLAFSPDSQRLAAAGSTPDGVVRLWDVASSLEVATLPGERERPFSYIGFSPDGNILFAASAYGPSVIWCSPSWEEIEEAEKRQATP